MSDYQRHGELIDKRFLLGLSPGESQELAQIQRRLDDIEGSFYRSAKQHLLGMLGGREALSKAITLWQPWATLVAIGAKQFETRSWLTRHRGLLVIHAAKRFTRSERLWCREEPFKSVLRDAGYPEPESLLMTLGKALCVVDVTAMYNTSDLTKGISEQERAFGNYEPGRFAWSLKNPRAFEPVPMRGWQGLWTLTPDERNALDVAIADSEKEKECPEATSE